MDKKKLTQEELNALSPRARKAYEGVGRRHCKARMAPLSRTQGAATINNAIYFDQSKRDTYIHFETTKINRI